VTGVQTCALPILMVRSAMTHLPEPGSTHITPLYISRFDGWLTIALLVWTPAAIDDIFAGVVRTGHSVVPAQLITATPASGCPIQLESWHHKGKYTGAIVHPEWTGPKIIYEDADFRLYAVVAATSTDLDLLGDRLTIQLRDGERWIYEMAGYPDDYHITIDHAVYDFQIH